MTSVRVRFAPSPTGRLHVGGARTALFNYLFARRHQGKFLLRIEDTDRQRSSDENIEVILQGLKYLGLEWDEEPIYQYPRRQIHQQAAVKLLNKGEAYRCFCAPDDLAKERKELEKQGIFVYPGHCRNLSESEIASSLARGMEYAVRFKVEQGVVNYHDAVHGGISVDCGEIDDFIILRRDGSPTYQLSVVIDDIDMGITHVIRGDDHISNTPKQILLHQALGYNHPEFAHIPLILGTDKKRLSKRHGAVSVLEYQAEGILGEALFNYLALLGWSPGDDREVMTRDEIIEAFSLQDITPKSAVFDAEKLRWMNGSYISAMETEKLADKILRWREEYGADTCFSIPDRDYFLKTVDMAKARMWKLSDFFILHRYYYEDPAEYDEKGVKKHFAGENLPAYLYALRDEFESIDTFNAVSLEDIIRRRADEWGLTAAKLIHPLRLAVTGFAVSPGIFELLEVLGKDRVIHRLEKAAEYIKGMR